MCTAIVFLYYQHQPSSISKLDLSTKEVKVLSISRQPSQLYCLIIRHIWLEWRFDFVREYTIFWIEEEFAYHYYGREGMFYRLFKELYDGTQAHHSILIKQMEYITKSIPGIHINQFINIELSNNMNYEVTKEGHCLTLQNGKSKARLLVNERSISLVGEGNYEAEMIFFDLLRKWDSRFLAIDFMQKRFGWVSPIKQRKFV
ncbi:sporulation inhibitor of replication protein SirA [Bacillus sp. BGMRC 2118]|nr:sporulation inhibitor of replication protein SirA [Bacillus sp. BGMRC 2118]